MKAINIAVDPRMYWKIEAVRPDRTVYLLADWFPNLVTNPGRIAMKDQANWMGYCQVGTSNVLPDLSQGQLQAWVAGTNTTFGSDATGSNVTPPYYGYRQRVWEFAATATEYNLQEVGTGYGSGAGGTGQIVSRGLIVDLAGDQTVATWKIGEILRVTGEMRYYAPTEDVIGSININGTDHDYVLSPVNIGGAPWSTNIGVTMGAISDFSTDWSVFDGLAGAITDAQPAGVAVQCDNANQYTTDEGTYTVGLNCDCGSAGWNFAGGTGFTTLRLRSTAGDYQCEFTPNVLKTNSFTMFFKFNLTWASELYNSTWEMEVAGAGDPVYAKWNTSVALDRLRINFTDQLAVDQELALNVPIGCKFTITDTITGKNVIYQSIGANIIGGTFMEYQVTQLSIDAPGPTVGNVCSIAATIS